MNLENIKVSVIIPVFNREKTIKRCIDSVISQTCKPYEIIMIDDGSTDKTIEIVRHIMCDFLHVIKQNHKGAQAARNMGIKKSKGNIIVFLDSDDYLPENSIEVRLNTLLDSGCALVYGNILTERNNSKMLRLNRFEDISEYNQKKYLMQEMSLCCTSTIMVWKKAVEEIGYLDEGLKAWQDDDLIISVGMKYKICHCGRNVAVMTQSRNSIVTNKENLYQGCKRIVKKYKKEIIRYTSYRRYIIWRIRVISSWAKFKEQNEKKIYKKFFYQNISFVLDEKIRRFFRHMYA